MSSVNYAVNSHSLYTYITVSMFIGEYFSCKTYWNIQMKPLLSTYKQTLLISTNINFVLLNLKFCASEKWFGEFFSHFTQENERTVALLYSRLIYTSYTILKLFVSFYIGTRSYSIQVPAVDNLIVMYKDFYRAQNSITKLAFVWCSFCKTATFST